MMKMKRSPKGKDIVLFAETDYILPETEKPIQLRPHQKVILKDCFIRDENGKFPYETIVYSCVKKSGKTEIGGLIGLWMAASECPYNEIYYIANDLEQSQSRGYRRVCQVIEACKIEGKGLGELQPQRSIIRFPIGSTYGTEIKAISSDYAGEAGANPGLTIFDELWAYISEASRRLWDEYTPVPTRVNSLRVIVTYAGFEGESTLLWEIYQLGKNGQRLYPDAYIDKYFADLPEIDKDALRYIWVNKEAGLYMYWDNKPRMPWQTQKYYNQQRKTLRPNAFRRLHQNEWVSATTSFISADMWDSCIKDTSAIMPGLKDSLFVGVDIGIKRDSTAVVAVYWDKDRQKIRLATHRIWQPSVTEPLEFEKTIESFLLDLAKNFKIGVVYYDPSQFVRSSQLLSGSGIPMHVYEQVPTNLTSMTQILFELIRGRNLEMYPSSELREQVLNSVIIEGVRGMRIAKEKASHKIDAIVALAMACQAAWDGAGLTSLPDSQPESASRWKFSSMGQPSMVEMDEEGSIISRSRWRI